MASSGVRYSAWVNNIELPEQYTSAQRYAWWCEFIKHQSFVGFARDSDSDSEAEADDMADRFPSIEDIEGGETAFPHTATNRTH